MIGPLVSILVLVAAVAVAYLLTIIDSIVHQQLYHFGLQFSYDWANPYWMILRMSLALLGLVAVASSVNITYFFWARFKRPEMARAGREEVKAEASPSGAGVPTLFQCTSCGRSITHPLRMLDFHSQRPKMINICPFCSATVVPISYAYTQGEATQAEMEQREEVKDRIDRSLDV